MSIFDGLFRSRDKPQNRTAGSAYSFYMGGSSSGKAVTERSAMQMTAVYSCVRILAEAVAGLPLHVYRYRDDGGKEKATDHPLYLLLHDEPNPEMSSFVFRETLMTHLLLWGNAYAQIIRNGKGEVLALYPLMPNKMSVERDENGQLYYTSGLMLKLRLRAILMRQYALIRFFRYISKRFPWLLRQTFMIRLLHLCYLINGELLFSGDSTALNRDGGWCFFDVFNYDSKMNTASL